MKNSDVLALAIKGTGVQDFFSVTGGAAVHIIESLTKVGGLKPHFHNHEQAAALAADAYARVSGFGICVVTTGPGVTNTLTGLLCSWQDSVPCLYISGQARTNFTDIGFNTRQSGTQHLEVVPLVQSLTKKAYMLQSGDNVLEKVLELMELAKSGRPGPVWLDIPLDLQLEAHQPDKIPSEKRTNIRGQNAYGKKKAISGLIQEIEKVRKPILMLGRGLVGIDKDKLKDLVQLLNWPIVTTWGFVDTAINLESDLDCGRVGVSGQRSANKIISESDFVLSIGCRWSQAVVGPDITSFAPNASVNIIDIDECEINKLAKLTNFNLFNARASDVVNELCSIKLVLPDISEWRKYAVSLKRFKFEQLLSIEGGEIDQYHFVHALQQECRSDTLFVVDGGGTIVYTAMQILDPRGAQRILIPSGSAPMGTGIPHAIGAHFAQAESDVILLCGDGSFPFNMQELESVARQKLPIKIVVFNNNGYLSIRNTQEQFLNGSFLGSIRGEGLYIPDIEPVSKAFSIPFSRVTHNSNVVSTIQDFVSANEPRILEVKIRIDQEIFPKTGFRRSAEGKYVALPLSQMHPPLNF